MREPHDNLDAYRNKRKFEATPEPRADRSSAAASASPLFVIQKHAAHRLHYDFRLELNGTLKSWAIPKGPCLDPSIKRMAVHVEDHPLSYADFEGIIPAGNYGAGTVIVWDIGTWECEGDAEASYQKGHLRFQLHGKKLQGAWHLVRTRGMSGKQESWLLIKQNDASASPLAQYDIVEAQPESALITAEPEQRSVAHGKPAETLPLMLSPQLATLTDAPPRGDGWIYEVKLDGYRLLTRMTATEGVHLFTRNGNDWTSRLKSLARVIERMNWNETWLDGEIVMFDSNGVSNFQRLQNAFDANETQHIVYMLFDLPYYEGNDLRSLPLAQRRALLRRLLNGVPEASNGTLRFSEHIDAKIGELFDAACRLRVEGLIGKRSDSAYTSGRTREWIKLKCLQRQEFVIGGYTDASNKNVRAIGALLLGVHDSDGVLHYVGKVGTGFTQRSSIELHSQLQSLGNTKSPFAESVRQAGVHWVKPSLLAEVTFAAWTDDGHIRHSSFQGLRTDKPASAITRELAVGVADGNANVDGARKRQSPRREPQSMKKINTADAIVAGVAITHPDRLIDKHSGVTKLDLVRYYERAAKPLLAHLNDRPVSLVRGPEGVGGEIFFQKHRGNLHIPALVELDSELMPNHPPLIAIDSPIALIQCAQMNVVEFHTWNARVGHIEQPDRIIFDLDPGDGIVWPQIIEAVHLMKAALDQLHLKSYLKTSGGKGLHVVVPLLPRDDWQRVRDFSEALARHMASTLPQLFVATSGPKNRIKRIFIDYLRNTRGATTASAFSARLRPGLGVSIPIDWHELDSLNSSAQWHVQNLDKDEISARMKCWRGYAQVKQTLDRALRALE